MHICISLYILSSLISWLLYLWSPYMSITVYIDSFLLSQQIEHQLRKIVLLIIQYPFSIISIFQTKQHIIDLNIDIVKIENADIFITDSFVIYAHFTSMVFKSYWTLFKWWHRSSVSIKLLVKIPHLVRFLSLDQNLHQDSPVSLENSYSLESFMIAIIL